MEGTGRRLARVQRGASACELGIGSAATHGSGAGRPTLQAPACAGVHTSGVPLTLERRYQESNLNKNGFNTPGPGEMLKLALAAQGSSGMGLTVTLP